MAAAPPPYSTPPGNFDPRQWKAQQRAARAQWKAQRAYYRGLRRPFHVGGDTSYPLPDRIGAPQWSVDNDNLSVTWSSAPDGFPAYLDAEGATQDPNKDALYSVVLSPGYLAETGATGAAFDLSGGRATY